MKIAIIGHGGAEKSTLEKALSRHYKLPLLHLDRLQFLPNWETCPSEMMQDKLANFLDTHDDWIIDGTYTKHLFERRLAEADRIIYLNVSPIFSLRRVVKRYFQYKGTTRDDIADDCPEKLDWHFISFILYKGRKPQKMAYIDQLCQLYKDKTTICRNQKEIDKCREDLLGA